MKRAMLWAVVAIAAALPADEGAAALFSSTNSMGLVGLTNFGMRTDLRRADTNGNLGTVVNIVALASGWETVSLTVDTVADTGRYDAINLATPYLATSQDTGFVPVNFVREVSPPNFPNPPVYQQVAGDYAVRVTYTDFITSEPLMTSAPVSPIRWSPMSNSFYIASFVSLTLPDIEVRGVLDLSGPTMTQSQPFTYVLRASAGAKQAVTGGIPGDPNFSDGFPFLPGTLRVQYSPLQASTPLFDGVVENVRFTTIKPSLSVNLFAPEPSSLGLVGMAACAGLRVARKQ